MTIYAASPSRVHLLTRTGMARHARELLMRSVNYESRFLMMVEVPDAPIAGIVASIASRPQAPLVGIVLTMATHTCLRGVLEARRLMAVTTSHFKVATSQRKTRYRVVKARGFPTLFRMTAFAPLALLTLVYIVLHMTGCALPG